MCDFIYMRCCGLLSDAGPVLSLQLQHKQDGLHHKKVSHFWGQTGLSGQWISLGSVEGGLEEE